MSVRQALALSLAILPLLIVAGCQSGGPRLAGLNPFHRPELTSITTPAQRVKQLHALAADANQVTPEQAEQVVVDLIRQLETEPDPLLRQALIETAFAFDTPLAKKTPIAGLQDDDPHVRRICCRLLERSPTADSVPALAAVAKQDSDFDVRLAAVRALGASDTPSTRNALLVALEDNDPAMQLVGVESMKRLTGRDLGGDVSAYLALAKQSPAVPPAAPATPATQLLPTTGPSESPIEVADRRFGWLPL